MKPFSVFILIIFIITACKDDNKQASVTSTTIQTAIEKVRLTSLKGEPIDLKLYKGKAVFINFWATWCTPCVLEMPAIRNAMDSLKNEDIEFLFASDESAEEIEGFEKKYSYHFSYYRSNNIEELGIMTLPTTFIFDKNGKQVYSEIGYHNWDNRSNLDMLLKFAKGE